MEAGNWLFTDTNKKVQQSQYTIKHGPEDIKHVIKSDRGQLCYQVCMEKETRNTTK